MYLGDSYVINVRDITKSAKPRAPQILDLNEKRVTDVAATSGQTIQLECAASGVPTPNIEWKFINEGGRETHFPLPATFTPRNVTMEIVVPSTGPVSGRLVGRYRCVATNLLGTDTKDFILKQQSPPIFITRPKESIVAPAPSKQIQLYCGASGTPTPKIVWYRNGVEIESSDNISKLSVAASSSSDTASYQCTAQNRLAKISSTAQIVVLG